MIRQFTPLSLGKVGESLYGLGDQRDCACPPLVGELMGEVKEAGGEDGGAEEAQEDTGADELVAEGARPFVGLVAATDRLKQLLQLSAACKN